MCLKFCLLCRLNEDEDVNNISVKTGIQHNFNTASFFRPRFCDHCGKVISGFWNQVLHTFEHKATRYLCRDCHARIIFAILAFTPIALR